MEATRTLPEKVVHGLKRGTALAGLGLTLAGIAACTFYQERLVGKEYTAQILQTLQPGSEVEILQGSFLVGSGVNRRKWEEVLWWDRNLRSNLAYDGVTEIVENPLFRPNTSQFNSSVINPQAWLAFFDGQGRAVAIVVDKNTDLEVTDLTKKGSLLDVYANLRKRVRVDRILVEDRGLWIQRPIAYFQDEFGLLHRIGESTQIENST